MGPPSRCFLFLLSTHRGCVLSLLSHVQLYNPMDCSPPGFYVHGDSLLCPPPWNFPNPGMETVTLLSPELARRFFTTSTTWEAHKQRIKNYKYIFIAIVSHLFQSRNPGSFFFFKLYIIVLVLPNIKMNPPQVYMCSPF